MDGNNTEDSCLKVDHLLEKYYLSILYTLEFILGMLGNSIVICGYIFCMKKWSTGNIYLFNLCVSDLAFLCTLPMLVQSYSKENWIYGDFMCQANRYLLFANLYTSILFLTFISIDRYMLIKHPFKEHLLQKKHSAIIISAAIWIIVTIEILPILTFIGPNNTHNGGNCSNYASSGDAHKNLIFSICLTFLGFLIPMCVMCFFYVKLVFVLRKRNEQLTAIVPLEKPLMLVILAMTIFSCLFTPYHIMRNVRIASRLESWKISECTKSIINSVYIISRPLAFMNSVINPVFYFLMGDNFRDMLMTKVRQASKRMKTYCI
ncbi:succinate receptor 1 isoform X2 [Microcaecilia unicolor]|uniref:Succinate receptor 1 isoform X2 n=1 Tax=Microcaecilia unicolor TaxID=1415580 RepID=A0A6P7Z536_9AMPH|nr:succinate receptor 1 isoform X2 [Microcaecilia unicolor]